MASSRWKRFAFFDRHTLTLPTDVLDNLVPTASSTTTTAATAAATTTAGATSSTTASSTTSTTAAAAATTTDSASRSTSTSSNSSNHQDAVSMAVTTAALPRSVLLKQITSVSSSSKKSASSESAAAAAAATAGDEDENAITAMLTSLLACSSNTTTTTHDGTTTTTAAVTLPSQAQQMIQSVTTTTTTTTGADARNTLQEQQQQQQEGLVLAFVSSIHTSLVHCVDVTCCCNPPVSSSSANAAAANTATETTLPTTAATETTGTTSHAEDLDGWRGYFQPFPMAATAPAVAAPNASFVDADVSSVATSNSAMTNIVAMAACRDAIPGATGSQQQQGGSCVLLACISSHNVCVWQDPHLHLSCRRPFVVPNKNKTKKSATSTTSANDGAVVISLQQPWNASVDGECCAVDILPGGVVAVGTSTGNVLVFVLSMTVSAPANAKILTLRRYLKIPSPPPSKGLLVMSVKLSWRNADNSSNNKASVFVSYHPRSESHASSTAPVSSSSGAGAGTTSTMSNTNTAAAGICCYDFPLAANAIGTASLTTLTAPSARHDLDGRPVGSSSLVDAVVVVRQGQSAGMAATTSSLLTVARPDGLYSYSPTERIGVAPVDGTKLAICVLPPGQPAERARVVQPDEVGAGYVLVASTDAKSGRDAVDIYDAINKLVAFHLLLSPGHKAIISKGVTTVPYRAVDGSVRNGRSSALVFTSGGSLVTLTEKGTHEKVSLLVQKNLYAAAIVVAYADPSFEAADITALYRSHAEHLYRKGDYAAAMEQYVHTIGSLESSHVIFRYLDAPKIPLLVQYLEQLRARDMATSVHDELLRTCYLKLNDTEAAEAIAAATANSSRHNRASLSHILSNLSQNPKEALATICSLDASQVAEILVAHGPTLARVMPRETAGIVIALTVGTYSPKALADAAFINAAVDWNNPMIQYNAAAATTTTTDDRLGGAKQALLCEPYPVHLFATSFLEHPKLLRLILAHCNRNKCPITPSLRRTLLELTLAEWNQAKRTGDTETEKLRHKEAIAALTDSHCRDIGDYDALVIVQLAGFAEGELLLYERLQMTPMLLERYAKDGSEKARRQMLAMAQSDPEILADVLGHFVTMASEKLHGQSVPGPDDDSENDEVAEILDDIQEALNLARRQGVLPPVRIARILAGEGTGQFSGDVHESTKQGKRTVPLSVALDYVGRILEESRKETTRLKTEVEEYNQLCNTMEREIDSLLRASQTLPVAPTNTDDNNSNSNAADFASRLSIDELYSKLRANDMEPKEANPQEQPREAFWRDMNQSEDTFDVIARYFAKGVIS